MRKRISAVVWLLIMLALVWYQAMRPAKIAELDLEQDAEPEVTIVADNKETIYFWYTDEALTEYLNSKAFEYMEQHEDIRVVPTCVSAVEYLEQIQKATQSGQAAPDLYIVSNDNLEKAYLAGLATDLDFESQDGLKEHFPQVAIDSVTYKQKQVALPLYYETSLFLYNKTYLDTMANTRNEAEISAEAAEEENEELSDEEKVPYVPVSMEDLIPKNFDDILSLADTYDAPEGVEMILSWDVSDIFYNYFFAGNYMNVGGPAGDEVSILDINNPQVVECLSVYQSLNQFFSLDAKENTYEKVLADFMEGKTIFTVATTDAIEAIEAARQEGSFGYEYGISMLPDVSETLQSKGLSVTNAIALNGYGAHKEIAKDFAKFLALGADQSFYERSGKLAATNDATYDSEIPNLAMKAYEKSASLPKIIEESNFWVQLERTLTGIWQGDDVEAAMANLQTQMKSQLAK